jgi:hypothetical protein
LEEEKFSPAESDPLKMSRGQQTQQLNMGNKQFGAETGVGNPAGEAALAGYQEQQRNPGYTGAEKTAITGATEGGVGAAFGSAAEGAANRAARTNNAAGLSAANDALARERMQTSGRLGAENQVTFANARLAGTDTANRGLGGLFGTGSGAANSTLEANAKNAATPGFWDQFGNTFAKGLGTALTPTGIAPGFG